MNSTMRFLRTISSCALGEYHPSLTMASTPIIKCLARRKHLKYSSCLYNSPNDTLEEAEGRMLALYTQRAEIKDGMSILEVRPLAL